MSKPSPQILVAIHARRKRLNIIKLRMREGLSYVAIGYLCGCSKQYVEQTLKANCTKEELEYATKKSKKVMADIYKDYHELKPKPEPKEKKVRTKKTPEERYFDILENTKKYVKKNRERITRHDQHKTLEQRLDDIREAYLDD